MRVPMRPTGTRLLLLAACLAVACGCKDKSSAGAGAAGAQDAAVDRSAEAPPENNWSTFAGDHGAFVEQKGVDATHCRVTCTLKDDTVAWTLDTCIGTKDDLRFVATDCGSVFVLVPYPEVETAWAQTPVLRIWGRDGLLREMKAAQFVPDHGELKVTKNRFRWLKGVMGEVGSAPRYSADNRGVDIVTLDDKERTVPLLPMPAAPPPEAAPEPPSGATAE